MPVAITAKVFELNELLIVVIFRKSLLVPIDRWEPETFEDFHQPEMFTRDYFERIGFHVCKIEPAQTPDPAVIQKIASLKLPMEILSAGIPDFLCWNSRMFFFVECKSGKSSLNDAQIRWLRNYKHMFDIMVLRIKPDKNDLISEYDPATSGMNCFRCCVSQG